MSHTHNQKTIQSYTVGFIVSLLLTLTAFGLVEFHFISTTYLYVSLGLLALTQLVVQAVCFIRLNASAEGRWNLLPFLFTIFIIAIFVGGSMWIMANLDYYMMN
jgi:cytochrome o ubiquinol oxidase operon protein cyoD